MPPYIIGILLGWILHTSTTVKDDKVGDDQQQSQRRYQFSVAFGWIISTLTALSIIFGLTPFYDDAPSSSSLRSHSLLTDEMWTKWSFLRICYGAFHRSAFALATGWLIFACTRQCGGNHCLFVI